MCGVIGIVARTPVSLALYEGLSLLQHRGQDAAGLMVCDDNRIHAHKDIGLVRDVFNETNLERLQGCFGVGHVRYPTSGSYFSSTEVQPLYTNFPYGISLAHNGNLVNNQQIYDKLTRGAKRRLNTAMDSRELWEPNPKRHLNTTMDSEVLLNMLAHQIHLHTEHKQALSAEDIFYAISGLNKEVSGGYAVVGVIPGQGLFAFRDPLGIRPLCLGRRRDDSGKWEYCVSSESAVFGLLGYQLERDIAPGEAIFITPSGEFHSRHCAEQSSLHPCLFEYVYLARPDSMLDGISVYQARVCMGASLARRIKREWPDYNIDAIIPIPESARAAALELSYHLNVRYREGLVKNRYVDRTFIMPSGFRSDSVRRKLSAIEREFRGRDVLLVDDSIVRGTTSRKIISLARAAGAKRVYFASAAPPIKYPNVYGINIPTTKELIAHDNSIEQVRERLGCDRLFYQDLQEMRTAIDQDSGQMIDFEDSCFSGRYLTTGVDEDYLNSLSALQSVAI